MTTPAEQEAKRRYPVSSSGVSWVDVRNRWQAVARRVDFVAGWEAAESRHREILEAAREYREADVALNLSRSSEQAYPRLHFNRAAALDALAAAAAALPKQEGAGV